MQTANDLMTPNKYVLVTGATGFIGSALLAALEANQTRTRRTIRNSNVEGVEGVVIENIDFRTDWQSALKGVGSIVHLAARVHVMKDTATNPLVEFRKVNVDGTLNLACQAAAAGVKRFVFLSSIKVNGEKTAVGHFFTPNDMPSPTDPYGISKAEAEEGLRQIADRTGMEVVIIRPTLVYGPGVRGNFLSMMRWLKKGIPLPLGAINNVRSLVALDNLVDLIITCLHHPAAANQTFLVSDGEDVSTTMLLRKTAAAMGNNARLVPVPTSLLKLGAAILGKREMAQRLCESLQVDIEKTRLILGWAPTLTLDQGLKVAVKDMK
jgi:nucleoside-diphosphate-sugar epimerase